MAEIPPESPVLPIQHFRMALRSLKASPELTSRLLEGSGMGRSDLENPDSEMPVSAIWSICDNVAQIFGEDWFFRLPVLWSVDTHSELGMAMRFAPDFGTAIEVVCEFAHVRWPVLRLIRTVDRSNVLLTIRPVVPATPQNWNMTNSIAALSFQTTAKAILSHGSEMIVYQLQGAPPSYGDRLLELFEGNASWGHRDTSFIVPKSLCAQISPLVNGSSFAAVLAALRALAAQKKQAMSLAVRVSEMLEGVAEGRLDAFEVARKMGISRRTLERRLAEEGSSFRMLSNESYKKRIERLMADRRLTAEAIAERLGYHDASSFMRACRRLFGVSFSQLGREVRARQK